ncbi:unnamed protein product [Paramecium pentaurelia]|uniref:Uncharacterized protein n=1 Tax=Paramecium pentaurelia TaxID=43138 RepID=A0A8S1YQG1_9CILI|nr:unnamed protein product [Paramecium pentaurelia]
MIKIQELKNQKDLKLLKQSYIINVRHLDGHGGGIYYLGLTNNEIRLYLVVLINQQRFGIKIRNGNAMKHYMYRLMKQLVIVQVNLINILFHVQEKMIKISFLTWTKTWIQFQTIKVDIKFDLQRTQFFYLTIQQCKNRSRSKSRRQLLSLLSLTIYRFKFNDSQQKRKYSQFDKNIRKFIIQHIIFIDYEAETIFGTMSDDGQYLITWDKQSQEIQISKYRE